LVTPYIYVAATTALVVVAASLTGPVAAAGNTPSLAFSVLDPFGHQPGPACCRRWQYAPPGFFDA
jgi:hypothetical protein